MKYSRPGGMSQSERLATIKRLGGGVLPNASGARAEAPAILAGSTPSRELVKPKLSPEEEAAAAANRLARQAAREKSAPAPTPIRPAPASILPPDPVNGVVDPLDAIHEAATDETTDDAATEEVITHDAVPADAQPESDSLLD